ncbi:MAG: hypothetical protein ACQEUT_13340 [Bacillota bacterium]
MMTYRKERDRNLLVAGRWSWMSLLGFACGFTFQWVRNLGLTCHQKWKRLDQPRQANVPQRKKAVFPFIL